MRIANRTLWLAGTIMLMLATGAAAAERSVTLRVDNMTCESCPYIVDKSLERVDGVIEAKVSFEQRTAVVRYDDERTDVDALTRATAEAGYPSRITESSP
jgi:mercuric ion binding protein